MQKKLFCFSARDSLIWSILQTKQENNGEILNSANSTSACLDYKNQNNKTKAHSMMQSLLMDNDLGLPSVGFPIQDILSDPVCSIAA